MSSPRGAELTIHDSGMEDFSSTLVKPDNQKTIHPSVKRVSVAGKSMSANRGKTWRPEHVYFYHPMHQLYPEAHISILTLMSALILNLHPPTHENSENCNFSWRRRIETDAHTHIIFFSSLCTEN
jgi:hypothetical protein